MHILDTLKTSIRALLSNKSRSFLTILGIVVGIASIILIASSGAIAKGAIVGELGGLGAETIVVRGGKQPEGFTDFTDVLFADSLKERELAALRNKSNVPDAISAEPEVFVPGVSISYKGESFKPTVLGLSAEFMMSSLGLEINDGVAFDESDIRAKAQVVMIGQEVVDELFGSNNPIGESIQIKDRKFRVIGTFKEQGQVVFFNVDKLALVPPTSAQTYLTGQKHYTQIIVKARDTSLVEKTVFDIKATLRDLHNIDNPEDDDFNIETQQGLVDQISSIIGTFTIFLSMVVAISLVVGGIGIMNIMLVSVTERTKEIGLRKAIGATSKDILRQFLFEATILTGIGGIIGIIIGSALAYGATIAAGYALGTDLAFSFPLLAACLGFVSSILVGVVFGLYPALQAAKKSPIEALRYE